MNVEDKVLIWRFNRGDCQAVRTIYEKYKSNLLALAITLLKDTAAAEDVVHDVFLSFLRLRHFRLTGSFTQALGDLPYEQREVVLLHHQGGLKFIEIAKSQEVSINTVLGRYRYGLEKLKTSMNGQVSHATERTN